MMIPSSPWSRWKVWTLPALACLLLSSGLAKAGPESFSPGVVPEAPASDDPEDPPCGPLLLNTDAVYENAYAWSHGGVAPPYYGAFAECFTTPAFVLCAMVLDLSTISGLQQGQVLDAYVWGDGGGEPGTVLFVAPGIDPGPVAIWPQFSRHEIAFPGDCYPGEGSWWAGCWGDWPGEYHGWYLAADQSGNGDGCPMTNIAPGLSYPTGWNDASVVWGTTLAMGIGMRGHSLLPSDVEDATPAVSRESWGGIKALYRE